MSLKMSGFRCWLRGFEAVCQPLGLTLGLLSMGASLAYPLQSKAMRSPPPSAAAACSELSQPLTPTEQTDAQIAWQFFVRNYHPQTGLVSAVDGDSYAVTAWDMGSYLMALNAARWLGLIDQADFDWRLNRFLKTLSDLPLFDQVLPNKAYSADRATMTNYENQPVARGIGWSALDLGRLLTALHTIRLCHPHYEDWIQGILSRWHLVQVVQGEQLLGAMVLENQRTLLVQEGRLGYEQLAAQGFQLWGLEAAQALAFTPQRYVSLYGVEIPVDPRDFHTTQGNNYVVSESYILQGIEFGWEPPLKEYARRVLQAQERRYRATGHLTALTEGHLTQPPYFLYNTLYANGVPWATISEQNHPYPELRTLSTKAAWGWAYLFPENAYAQQLRAAVQTLRDPARGFYAGRFEASQRLNPTLSLNTNGIILEILYFKARGNCPLTQPKSTCLPPQP